MNSSSGGAAAGVQVVVIISFVFSSLLVPRSKKMVIEGIFFLSIEMFLCSVAPMGKLGQCVFFSPYLLVPHRFVAVPPRGSRSDMAIEL